MIETNTFTEKKSRVEGPLKRASVLSTVGPAGYYGSRGISEGANLCFWPPFPERRE